MPRRNDPFNFPPGFRFCPFDHELILYYLMRKVMNQILPPNKIVEVNLYQYSPDELSAMFPTLGENEWYFFTPRDKKYRNGTRPSRSAGGGFWKATGADRSIKHQSHGIIGFRKALVYYEGRPPKGDKTNWIMHEYRVKEAPPPKVIKGGDNDMRLDDWVLCRIYKKADKLVKCGRKAQLSVPDQNMVGEFGEEVQLPPLPIAMPSHPPLEFGHEFNNGDGDVTYEDVNQQQQFISGDLLGGEPYEDLFFPDSYCCNLLLDNVEDISSQNSIL